MPDPGDGRLLQACLNGARLPCEHPRLPVTAAALAREAAKVHDAGVDAVHLHVKDHQGIDTLDAAAMAEVLEAGRAEAPGVVVGISTGAGAARPEGANPGDPGMDSAAMTSHQ